MLNSVLKRVESTREKMIQTALEKGILDDETIRLSEELDKLLNEFQYLEKNDIIIKKVD
ncbi:aspartyl-phosphate phosphatase Spo0E family protein [Psychrobacillus vulpis]|uniref:Aspartyl-phosphate phosphatase Spo0E family protein n=1 Tax=Psychrobacillus vulpis TaxID=2325572 RepID=A0A544TRV8_9BACI|nr:aspartyl-phosphate phosphatase Spo0E family protein [Psychrobacillus vulpis]TQR20179.1 aspartyl-phosphate phosphatase Spo0E family protein [Psychrobacillus vulpis]